MTKRELLTHDESRLKRWRDPEYRKAYRRLRPRYDVIGELIRLREHLELTQEQLANLAGTHQSRISKIESAETDLLLSTLVLLADVMDADVRIYLEPRLDREDVTGILKICAESEAKLWPLSASTKETMFTEEMIYP